MQLLKFAKDLGQSISFDDLLKLARKRPFACISAVTPYNINNPTERHKATRKLAFSLARFDYFRVKGCWLDEDGNPQEEESYVVLGSPYRGIKEQKAFEKAMVNLCREYDQDAVLIVTGIENLEDLNFDILNKRYDEYSVFTDPRFLSSPTQDDYQYHELIKNQETPIIIYSLYAKYLDKEGNVTQEFNNVTPKHIGKYFTEIGYGSKAHKFTLLANKITSNDFVLKFTPLSKTETYQIDSVSGKSYDDRVKYLEKNQQSPKYQELKQSMLNSLLTFLGKN